MTTKINYLPYSPTQTIQKIFNQFLNNQKLKVYLNYCISKYFYNVLRLVVKHERILTNIDKTPILISKRCMIPEKVTTKINCKIFKPFDINKYDIYDKIKKNNRKKTFEAFPTVSQQLKHQCNVPIARSFDIRKHTIRLNQVQLKGYL